MKTKTSGAFTKCDNGWMIDTKVKVDGVWKHLSKKGYATLGEAKADYQNVVSEFIERKSNVKKEPLFDDLVNDYCDMRSSTITYGTMKNEIATLQVHLKPFYGKRISESLTMKSVREWRKGMIAKDGISTNRKNCIIGKMKGIIKFAFAHRYIGADTYQDCDIELYQMKETNTEHHVKAVWSDSERDRFFDYIKTESYDDYFFFKLLAGLGTRVSELLGIQVKSIDRNERTLSITQQVKYVDDGVLTVSSELKTKSSYRIIPIPDSLFDMIMRYISLKELGEDDYIFQKSGKDGTFHARATYGNRLKRYCRELGITEITLHSMRHMLAIRLASVSKTIEDTEASAAILGHSPQMFMNTYANHSNTKMKKSIIDRIAV